MIGKMSEIAYHLITNHANHLAIAILLDSDTALAAAAAPIFPFSRGRGAHFPIFTAVRSLGKGNRD